MPGEEKRILPDNDGVGSIADWLAHLGQDIRYAFRILRRGPGFSIITVLTLALGIGANTAVFSVVYGVLLRPLPYPKAYQIVELWEVDDHGNRMNFADPTFDDIRRQSGSLQGLAEYAVGTKSIFGGNEARRLAVAEVSREFFSVMGVKPLFGRGFSDDEQRFGAALVAMVSYSYWRQTLGSTTDWSTTKLIVEDHAVPVIGVLPPGFSFPGKADIWVPREAVEDVQQSRSAHNWPVIGRLRDGTSKAQAQAELSGISQRLRQQFGPDINTVDMAVTPLQDVLTGSVRPILWVSFAAVGFLLLVSCANAVNLLLAQASGRHAELAVRAALGASRGRLMRQFLAESLLLALCGGLLGVVAAIWSVGAIVKAAPGNLPNVEGVSVNLAVLIFAFGVSLLVAVGLGISTAVRATAGNLQSALVEGNRGQAGSLRSHRLRRLVLAAQVAMTVVLLVGAGLLGRSLLRVLSVDPGFRTEQVVTMDLSLPFFTQPADAAQRVDFFNSLFERLRRIPSVSEVGGSIGLPLARGLFSGNYLVMNNAQATLSIADMDKLFHNPAVTGSAEYCVASEGYFKVLGIPLVRGRLFDDHDTIDAPHVAVINESVAREKWPNQNPLGHTIEFGNMDGDLRLLTVIGVVGDIHQSALERDPKPTIYLNYRQRPKRTSTFTVVMRASGPPATVLASARQVLAELDPTAAPSFNTFTQVVAASTKMRRFNVLIVGFFAVTALLLTMLGIYGVMSYSVTQRTREIGVRMALGATAGSIMRLILFQSISITAVGLAIGIITSFLLVRTMAALLFGVTATDPLTALVVGVLLFLVTLVASYLPAKRAMRVDPFDALRGE